MVPAWDTKYPGLAIHRRSTVTTASGFPCCKLPRLVSLILLIVWTGTALPTDAPYHTRQQLRRVALQANGDGGEAVPNPCDARLNETGSANACPEPLAQEVQTEPSVFEEDGADGDDGHDGAVISASTVAAVVGFIASMALLFGYIYYKKDPDKFRKKYGKIMSIIPSRYTQQKPQPTSPPSTGPPPPVVTQPQVGHLLVPPVPPPPRPTPAPLPLVPFPQLQARSSGQRDGDLPPLLLSSSAPATQWQHREMPGARQPATVVHSGFVLPENVPQVPGPRMVPSPALTVGGVGQEFPHSTGTHAQQPVFFQPGGGMQDAWRWGQAGLHTFNPHTSNFQQDADSSQHSHLSSEAGAAQANVAPGQESGHRPPLSPFFGPGTSQSSQRGSETRGLNEQQTGQVAANTDVEVPPDQQNSHPGPGMDLQGECPELDYDIRVLPLSDRPTVLGRGAFGTVEPGVFTDSSGNIVHVAVKYGTELFQHKRASEVLSIFQSELNVMCKVPAHDNIVHCYGGRVKFDDEEAIGARDVYIVEELMHANLQDVIYGDDFSGGLPYKLILKIALHIATGLEHLHRAGVLHYDLKPANILVDEVFNAKIADFGSSQVKATSYITGTFRGTIGYMAPELWVRAFVRNIQINEKIDVYSFGVVLWEMVEQVQPPNPLSAGDQNFPGGRIEQVPTVEEDRFPLSRRCPEGLRQLIQDCVNLTPQRRPGARQVRERVEEMIAQSQKRSNLATGVDG